MADSTAWISQRKARPTRFGFGSQGYWSGRRAHRRRVSGWRLRWSAATLVLTHLCGGKGSADMVAAPMLDLHAVAQTMISEDSVEYSDKSGICKLKRVTQRGCAAA